MATGPVTALATGRSNEPLTTAPGHTTGPPAIALDTPLYSSGRTSGPVVSPVAQLSGGSVVSGQFDCPVVGPAVGPVVSCPVVSGQFVCSWPVIKLCVQVLWSLVHLQVQ